MTEIEARVESTMKYCSMRSTDQRARREIFEMTYLSCNSFEIFGIGLAKCLRGFGLGFVK